MSVVAFGVVLLAVYLNSSREAEGIQPLLVSVCHFAREAEYQLDTVVVCAVEVDAEFIILCVADLLEFHGVRSYLVVLVAVELVERPCIAVTVGYRPVALI